MTMIPRKILTNKHSKYLETVRALAINTEATGSAKVAAAIVYKGVMYFGTNSKKTHPFQAKYGKNNMAIYLHAETSAIKNALRHLSLDEISKSTLYIARVKKLGPKTNSWVDGIAKPCEGCARCISEFNIKKVFYTKD